MVEKKKVVVKKPLNVKVITDKGEGDATFEKLFKEFVNRDNIKIVSKEYAYRNNANQCYVEYTEGER